MIWYTLNNFKVISFKVFIAIIVQIADFWVDTNMLPPLASIYKTTRRINPEYHNETIYFLFQTKYYLLIRFLPSQLTNMENVKCLNLRQKIHEPISKAIPFMGTNNKGEYPSR